jgi:hypothetical protein
MMNFAAGHRIGPYEIVSPLASIARAVPEVGGSDRLIPTN